jgi:hypothetical protein
MTEAGPQHWDLLIDRTDLARTEVRSLPAPDTLTLADGEVLLETERFALTANNITYGVYGDRLGYWRFFPAEDNWGRIPVWGFATVRRSAVEGIAAGTRLFVYLPMASHWVTRLERRPWGVVDVSPHRAELPPAYNSFAEAAPGPLDDQIALLRPLFLTSFLLDDWFAANADFGATTFILSSASSKTALGLAWLLAGRGVRVIGLTSPGNTGFVEGVGWYAETRTYAALAETPVEGPVAFVDFAGNPEVVSAVHHSLGDRLVHSAVVGSTHQAGGAVGPGRRPGPRPTFFFAPDRVRQRIKDWGPAEFNQRTDAALHGFITANGWLQVETHTGSAALEALYQDVLSGRAAPETGQMVRPDQPADGR